MSAKLGDADTGAVLVTLSGHTGSAVEVAFSPDGTRILTAVGLVARMTVLTSSGRGTRSVLPVEWGDVALASAAGLVWKGEKWITRHVVNPIPRSKQDSAT